MSTETQIRSQILRKIQRIPSSKLRELNDFVLKLEQTSNKKDKIRSFAGAWANIDSSTIIELTDNLIVNRENIKRRPNE